jgi:phospholipase C
VDGLACTADVSGNVTCSNANLDDDGSKVVAFHATSRCVRPDLDHSWLGTHQEINFENPNATLLRSLSNGFVLVNDATEQIDSGESATEDQTISFYDNTDLPFYYGLAENFAIADRHFASTLGPTFPNRSYLMAATSFGHLTTDDTFPPPGGYKPITGTIFDLFDQNGVSWADYFQDAPQSASFRPTDAHNLPLAVFLAQAAGIGSLPQVSFVDPNFGLTGHTLENDEHPPTDIQRGQFYVSQVINAVRNGPYWKDSIIFLTYDEHGGFYDHAKPAKAPQGGALNPDGINPGQCEDLSNPPASEQPGGGAECAVNPISATDTSVKDAEAVCPALAADPTGPYPASCANFNQLGVRVPLIAISPFSKPAYVSHAIGDHTSLLALIEKRFLMINGKRLHLTLRDQYANTLEDMFDFNNSPSLSTPVGLASPPATDCTPIP